MSADQRHERPTAEQFATFLMAEAHTLDFAAASQGVHNSSAMNAMCAGLEAVVEASP